jgi:hypothetical protein
MNTYEETFNRSPFVHTRNLFIEYFNELNLNWAIDLNAISINNAYNQFEDLYNASVEQQITPPFKLETKIAAKDYLLSLCK